MEKELSKAHGGLDEALRHMGTRLAGRVKKEWGVSGGACKSELPTGPFTQEGLGKYGLKKYVDRLFANKQGHAEEMKEAVKPAEKQEDKQARKKLLPILHLNGPEYGVDDFTAATNRFHNENIGTLEEDYHYESQPSLDYLASRGWRYVKVPLRWERMQRTINGDLSQEELLHLSR